MTCQDCTNETLESGERIDREWDDHLGHSLEKPITLIDEAWKILDEELQRFGIESDRPVPDNDTRIRYFNTMKWDALEISDGIYSFLNGNERAKDNTDLEEFEASGRVRRDFSPRVKALAKLTFAKCMVEIAARP